MEKTRDQKIDRQILKTKILGIAISPFGLMAMMWMSVLNIRHEWGAEVFIVLGSFWLGWIARSLLKTIEFLNHMRSVYGKEIP